MYDIVYDIARYDVVYDVVYDISRYDVVYDIVCDFLYLGLVAWLYPTLGVQMFASCCFHSCLHFFIVSVRIQYISPVKILVWTLYIIFDTIYIYILYLDPEAKFQVELGRKLEQEVLGARRSERACQSHPSLEDRP